MAILDLDDGDGEDLAPLDEELPDEVLDRLRAYERRLDRLEGALDDAEAETDLEDIVESMPATAGFRVSVSTSAGSYRMTIPRDLGDEFELTGTDQVAIRDVSERTDAPAFLVTVV
ncbi:hypothetical protein GJ633_09395 [Halorubrum sp. CBA1125]|uniref:hypothetical protein n=1 Tax=Halorubrum sp. CBA1125 TaxID=2668072 RepID=UPI0012E884A7|nr:hypothetical protein [Halorubrum sp. CBA1125]MUW14854.1 hypothetical protein [Halorubrum sp. CBA1125]